MKINLMMFATVLLVMSAYPCVAQVEPPKPNGPVNEKEVPNKPPPSLHNRADLVVMTIKGGNLDSGEATVTVKNQGTEPSVRSDVELKVTNGSQPSVSIVNAIPPMQPGSTETVTFNLNQSIVQAGFCATVDNLKKVKESNEKNNRRCGKFSGKP